MSAEWKVPLVDVSLTEEDIQKVAAVLRSGWLSMGPETERFEQVFAQYTGSEHAIAVANGTAALHLALLAAGVGAGEEVIVPSLTFVASVAAIEYTGATPVFADISALDRPWLSAEACEAAIGERTAAILAVSYGGDSGEIEALRAVADKRGLTLLEDAAHAAGSRLDGRHMGTFGAAGAFSFYANKNLAIGEGGAVITDDAAMASRMRLLRSHGMSSVTWERHRRVGTYEALALGYNYRLDEPRAALARARLSRLDDENRERERLDQRYRELLSELDIGLCCEGEPRLEASRHLFAVVLPPRCNRDQVRDELAKHGVQTSIHYPPVHTFRRYEEVETRLPLTEAYGSRTLTLPMFAAMTEAQQDLVVRALWESVSAG